MGIRAAIKNLALAIFVVVVIVACSSNQPVNRSNSQSSAPSADCRTIPHRMGETQLCGQPRTIVALGPNMLETLLALEVQPAGYGDYFSLPYRKFDQPSQQIQYLGKRITSQPVNVGTWDSPSLEALLKLKPDLILGTTEANEGEYGMLSQIAPTLLFTYDEPLQNLRTVAKALGRSQQAKTVIAAQNQHLATTRKVLQPFVDAYPRVMFLTSDQLAQNLRLVQENGNCSSRLLKELGFQLVSYPGPVQLDRASIPISLEILPQLDADWILIDAYNQNFSNPGADPIAHQLAPVKKQWQDNPIAQSLKASQAGRVYFNSPYVCGAMPGPIGTELFLNTLRDQLLSSK